jgi:hypothetical protein
VHRYLCDAHAIQALSLHCAMAMVVFQLEGDLCRTTQIT